MLAVDPALDPGSDRHELAFQCGQVAAVEDRWLELSEQAKKPDEYRRILAGFLVQRVKIHRLGRDALAKIRVIGERHHGMAEALRRQMIEQVHHAVFHAPRSKPVDQMDDQGAVHFTANAMSPC